MSCIKTGCHIHIEPYGEFAYGDAYRLGDTLVFRLVKVSRTQIRDELIHAIVKDVDVWFDKGAMEKDPSVNSTLISRSATLFGYEGLPFEEATAEHAKNWC
jgi:hypothetical protein